MLRCKKWASFSLQITYDYYYHFSLKSNILVGFLVKRVSQCSVKFKFYVSLYYAFN